MTGQLNWLKYNWKWALPMAMLGVFVPVTSCVMITVLLVSFLAVRSLKIYRLTLAAVRSNSRVIDLIGAPVQPGLLVLGTFNRRVAGTMVNLNVPLYGPKGRATAFAVAKKTENSWQFTTLEVQARGQKKRIDLLET